MEVQRDMKTRTSILIAGLILAAIVTTPAAAADQRPMSGQFTAQAGPSTPRCGPDALTLGFEIKGVASHLGSLAGSGSNCTEFTLTTDAVAVWDGLVTLIAADGSTLTSTYSGAQGAPIAGRAPFENTLTITGGTGRFADADGVWILTGFLDFTTGVIDGRVAGWLSY
jgi:hypothetical protein